MQDLLVLAIEAASVILRTNLTQSQKVRWKNVAVVNTCNLERKNIVIGDKRKENKHFKSYSIFSYPAIQTSHTKSRAK